MKIWAIADLHLAISTPDKTMEVFGKNWKNYQEKIKTNWLKHVTANDLVCIAGDISWAKHLDQALIDLQWLDALPGKKILIKGNHDYWWSSITKLRDHLPSSIFVLQNDSFSFNNISIAGARLWESEEYSFDDLIDYKNVSKQEEKFSLQENEKIFNRELGRLQRSLSSMTSNAQIKIVMTHYPPLSVDLKNSQASRLIKKYDIDFCVFGHLHNLKDNNKTLFGKKGKTSYIFTSCDYLDFCPVLLTS